MKNFSYRLCLIYFLLFVMVSTVSSACSNEERTSVVKNEEDESLLIIFRERNMTIQKPGNRNVPICFLIILLC